MAAGIFFNFIKSHSRQCTSKSSFSNLRKIMKEILKKLWLSRKLFLAPKKKVATIDYSTTKNAYVVSRFSSGIDGDITPNTTKIMRMKNVQFSSNPALRELFFKRIQNHVTEMLAAGSIYEGSHDSLVIPIDRDCCGNLWFITSTSILFKRSRSTTTLDVL